MSGLLLFMLLMFFLLFFVIGFIRNLRFFWVYLNVCWCLSSGLVNLFIVLVFLELLRCRWVFFIYWW